jgi:hypothetical protein
MHNNNWARLPAYVSGLVNQRLLLQCEYLSAANRTLRFHVPGQLRLTDAERSTLCSASERAPISPPSAVQPKPVLVRRAPGALGQVRMPRQANPIGERSLQRALAEFIAHYHCERNHQVKNVLLFPALPRQRDAERFIVAIFSEACFDTTADRREYFGRTG